MYNNKPTRCKMLIIRETIQQQINMQLKDLCILQTKL